MVTVMPDIQELTSIQKAAIVVTTLGAENASHVYKRLSEDDVERLTYEISCLPYVEVGMVDEVLNEFYELCLTQKVITEGGVDYARAVLEKAYGPEMASRLMERVSKSMQTKAFEFVRKSDYKNLLAIIQNENPQTIALVLSYVKSEQASAVLQELPKEKRVEVV
jgi:flagellar motor switch protein FliG